MLCAWFFEIVALIALPFGFGATAAAAYDLAKLSFFFGPVYDLVFDLGKLVLFGNR